MNKFKYSISLYVCVRIPPSLYSFTILTVMVKHVKHTVWDMEGLIA